MIRSEENPHDSGSKSGYDAQDEEIEINKNPPVGDLNRPASVLMGKTGRFP